MEATLERSIEYSPGGVWDQQTADELLVFDVSLYSPGSFEVIRSDALGLITEKISSEEENGQPIFDEYTQVALQLTPPKHAYLLRKNSKTEQLKMVAPEHVHPEDEDQEKDLLESITNWRNGVDKAAMSQVRQQFMEAEGGEMLFWFSGRAQEWEPAGVKRFNGQYGYFYAGRVVIEDGIRRMVVSDFKVDLNQQACRLFLQKVGDSLHHRDNPDLDQHSLYKDMTTIAKMRANRAKDWTTETIWKNLSEAKRIAQGEGKIFNLEVEKILKLQDEQLQEEIKEGSATEVARWIASQLDQGVHPERIQPLVRRRFVDATCEQLRLYRIETDLASILNGGSTPLGYTGSNGDFCGSWGGSDRTVIIKGEAYFRTDSGELIKGILCPKCGEVNICKTEYCYKDDCQAKLPRSSKSRGFSLN